MADRNYDVSVVFGMIDNISDQLGVFANKVEESKKSIKELGEFSTVAGAAISAAVGFMVSNAASFQTAYNQLSIAVNMTGSSFDDSKDKIDGFIRSMTEMTTVSDDQAAEALKRMVVYTKDVDDAMEGVRIAAGMTAAGFGDLDRNARLVGMAMNGNIEMLGRLLPEFRGFNTVLFEGMTSTEKAAYAMDVLRRDFGNMAGGELNTFAGQFKQLKNMFEEFTQTLGNTLLPTLTMTARALADDVKATIEWVDQHKVLVGAVVETAAQAGVLLTVFGSLLLALPKLISAFQALNVWVMANPWLAAVGGVTALIIALENLDARMIDESNANINTGRTIQDKIKLMQAEEQKYKDLATSGKLSEVEREQALNKMWAAETAIDKMEEQLQTEALRKKKAKRDADAADAYAKLIEQNRLTMKANDDFYADYVEYQNRLKAVRDSHIEDMKTSWSGALNVMRIELINATTNYYQIYSSAMASITSSTAAAFSTMFANIGQGWSALRDLTKSLLDGIKNAIFNMLGQVIAQWIVQHTAMRVITEVWKHSEIVAAAEVGAAKAAAATAWTLWGAIGIGLAIGAAIMALEHAFAGGVDNFYGGMALVGERGPELVNLPLGSSVHSNAKSAGMLAGGGSSVNIYVTGNTLLSERSVSDLADKIGKVFFRKVTSEVKV